MKNGSWDRHYNNECLVECKCGEQMTRSVMLKHRRQDCPVEMLPCDWECGVAVQRQLLDNHRDECKNRLVSCSQSRYNTCGAKLDRREVDEHREMCPCVKIAELFKEVNQENAQMRVKLNTVRRNAHNNMLMLIDCLNVNAQKDSMFVNHYDDLRFEMKVASFNLMFLNIECRRNPNPSLTFFDRDDNEIGYSVVPQTGLAIVTLARPVSFVRVRPNIENTVKFKQFYVMHQEENAMFEKGEYGPKGEP